MGDKSDFNFEVSNKGLLPDWENHLAILYIKDHQDLTAKTLSK